MSASLPVPLTSIGGILVLAHRGQLGDSSLHLTLQILERELIFYSPCEKKGGTNLLVLHPSLDLGGLIDLPRPKWTDGLTGHIGSIREQWALNANAVLESAR